MCGDMKKFILVFFALSILSLVCAAQNNNGIIIKGKVIDSETDEPLLDANIFLMNTTIGTTSNANGEFSISNIPYGSYNVIFSYVGYRTEIRSINLYKDETIEFGISLEPKSIKLDHVDITAAIPKDWKENLEDFTKIFIGETANSGQTKILNPEVLNFEKDEDSRTFKAYSDSLLRIENKALGYLLYIVLDSLVHRSTDKKIIYGYYPWFEEMVPISAEEKETWQQNRKETYLNSPRHFYYSLVHNQLSENHFLIRQQSGYVLDPEDLALVSNSDSTIYAFGYSGQLEVDYLQNKKSKLTLLDGSILIDENGNLLSHYYSVEISGYWANQRMADTLPKNYSYKGD